MTEKLPPIIGTHSGGSFNVLAPDPADVRVGDIATVLSKICRYTGHTTGFWSVADHSVEVAHRLEALGLGPTVALQGLLHDASEAYLVDLARPIKDNAWAGYREIEEQITLAICTKVGVEFPFHPAVKDVDDGMIRDEVANFFPPYTFMWERYKITSRSASPYLCSFATREESRDHFYANYQRLQYLVSPQ